MRLTDDERKWLERLAETGTWPERPFLRDAQVATSLMRKGLAEVVKPEGPYLPYAAITSSGRAFLSKDTPAGRDEG